MSDRELLELAAKAAGIELVYGNDIPMSLAYMVGKNTVYKPWNPLTDDGDALRLAVKLEIDVHHGDSVVVAERVGPKEIGVAETKTQEPHAATRRAIVRAAAEIGRSM